MWTVNYLHFLMITLLAIENSYGCIRPYTRARNCWVSLPLSLDLEPGNAIIIRRFSTRCKMWVIKISRSWWGTCCWICVSACRSRSDKGRCNPIKTVYRNVNFESRQKQTVTWTGDYTSVSYGIETTKQSRSLTTLFAERHLVLSIKDVNCAPASRQPWRLQGFWLDLSIYFQLTAVGIKIDRDYVQECCQCTKWNMFDMR